jgi:hypothetical protein
MCVPRHWHGPSGRALPHPPQAARRQEVNIWKSLQLSRFKGICAIEKRIQYVTELNYPAHLVNPDFKREQRHGLPSLPGWCQCRHPAHQAAQVATYRLWPKVMFVTECHDFLLILGRPSYKTLSFSLWSVCWEFYIKHCLASPLSPLVHTPFLFLASHALALPFLFNFIFYSFPRQMLLLIKAKINHNNAYYDPSLSSCLESFVLSTSV